MINQDENTISWEDFQKVQICAGTIIGAEDFPEARQPAYKLKVDLGDELGIKNSSAQVTHLYDKDELIGKKVLCVINFPPKRIAGFKSEILVTGLYRKSGEVVLASIDKDIENGARLA